MWGIMGRDRGASRPLSAGLPESAVEAIHSGTAGNTSSYLGWRILMRILMVLGSGLLVQVRHTYCKSLLEEVQELEARAQDPGTAVLRDINGRSLNEHAHLLARVFKKTPSNLARSNSVQQTVSYAGEAALPTQPPVCSSELQLFQYCFRRDLRVDMQSGSQC
ncbi:Phospholipid-transporting ATPase IB [Acipenser ruthenus]|uniref:Phospholipid-transporting ATPase IB n=1 Tax=Acipenser ruthenus TaxID=7906 RepID=A0A444V6C1_ACIRT|nr:Phospholipid-transporting ATPase IB [Acipenser ruthenus]